MTLSVRQQAIVAFVADFHRRNQYGPSFKDIASVAGLRSTSTVAYHLKRLADAGLVTSDYDLPRTLRLAGSVAVWPSGDITRTVLVEQCAGCEHAHPSDLSCATNPTVGGHEEVQPA